MDSIEYTGAAAEAQMRPPVDIHGYTEYADFRNVQSRSRQERRNLMDKETREKQRLSERRGGYHHYEDLGMVTVPTPEACGFCSERERFQKDFAYYERERRQIIYQKKENALVQKQERLSRQEEARWDGIESQYRRDEERLAIQRAEGKKARRNAQSVPYDPITLKYRETLEGARLRNADHHIKHRAAMRSMNLQKISLTYCYRYCYQLEHRPHASMKLLQKFP